MHILLPFHDDSALIFARTMGDGLTRAGAKVTYAHVTERLEIGSKISERQLSLYLPQGPDIYILGSDIVSDELLFSFDAIIFNRLLLEVNNALESSEFKSRRDRSCLIAFLPGLEFFPERGIANRCKYDILYLNYNGQREFLPEERNNFFVGVGHPSFSFRPQSLLDPKGKLLFAAQAISPLTIAGRVHMANLVVATALANPDREIVIKLRHKPDENKHHAHKEVFAYEHLMASLFPRLPPNLAFDDGSMLGALQGAAACLACTSTAVMDAIANGIPAMVYLSYPEAASDPLMPAMRREFADSGLIVTSEDVISLNIPTPSSAWLEEKFQKEFPFGEIIEQVENFHRSRQAPPPEEAPGEEAPMDAPIAAETREAEPLSAEVAEKV